MSQPQSRTIPGTAIEPGMTLVGDFGGLTLISGDVKPSAAMPGLLHVETEHGTLYLDPDLDHQVLQDG